MIERPTKRKAYRKMKAEVYRKNKEDSNLERAARNNTCKDNIFFVKYSVNFQCIVLKVLFLLQGTDKLNLLKYFSYATPWKKIFPLSSYKHLAKGDFIMRDTDHE